MEKLVFQAVHACGRNTGTSHGQLEVLIVLRFWGLASVLLSRNVRTYFRGDRLLAHAGIYSVMLRKFVGWLNSEAVIFGGKQVSHVTNRSTLHR